MKYRLYGICIYLVCMLQVLVSEDIRGHNRGHKRGYRRRPYNTINPHIKYKNTQRILYCIAGTSAKRIDVMTMLLDNTRDWCEGGFNVTVIIDTYDDRYDHILSTYSRSCVASTLRILVQVHDQAVNLVTAHRSHFLRWIDHYDLFVYSEDDMSLPLATIKRHQYETALLPDPSNQVIGLWRYENALAELRLNRKRIQKFSPNFSYFQLNESQQLSLRSKVTWEPNASIYSLVPLRAGDDKLYISNAGEFHTKPYAAATILTPLQLRSLETRCSYLSTQTADQLFPEDNNRLRAFYSGFQVFHCENMTVPLSSSTVYSREFFCCMEWLLPIDYLEVLLIHHIGTPGAFSDNKWDHRNRIKNVHFVQDWQKWINVQKSKMKLN